MAPGGGVDDGESELQAGIREVAEETGCVLTEQDLLGPIAVRRGTRLLRSSARTGRVLLPRDGVPVRGRHLRAHRGRADHDQAAPLVVARRSAAHGRGSGPRNWSSSGHWRVSPSPGRSSLVPRRSRPSSTSTDRAKDRDQWSTVVGGVSTTMDAGGTQRSLGGEGVLGVENAVGVALLGEEALAVSSEVSRRCPWRRPRRTVPSCPPTWAEAGAQALGLTVGTRPPIPG